MTSSNPESDPLKKAQPIEPQELGRVLVKLKEHSIANWQEDAECRGADGDPFFGSDEEQKKMVNEYCNNCPVSEECLEAAMQHEKSSTGLLKSKVDGVWGGMTESQRRKFYRRIQKEQRAS